MSEKPKLSVVERIPHDAARAWSIKEMFERAEVLVEEKQYTKACLVLADESGNWRTLAAGTNLIEIIGMHSLAMHSRCDE